MPGSAISLSCRGLARCAAIYDQEFVFTGHNFEYKCKTIEACFLSPRVCDSLRSDPSIDHFSIEYEGNDGAMIFETLWNLIHGKSVELTAELSSGLVSVSSALGNDEILHLLIERFDSIDVNNICRRLEIRSLLGNCELSEIEFAASHFTEIKAELLRQLPICVLESILSCSSLRLKDEDSLLEFINTIECECDREVLYRYLKTEYLSCEGIRLLIEDLRIESLDCLMWSSLCHRLLLHVHKMPTELVELSKLRFINPNYVHRVTQELPFSDGLPFDGIISFLTAKVGGNIHTKGIVNISSSSDEYNHCWQVADHGWNNCWHTRDEPNSWISFDFKDRRVRLSHYTLKSRSGGVNFFQTWVIEGSNDSESWIELDRRSTHDLVGKSIVKTYPCSNTCSTEFRYLRMRQTGATSHNQHYFPLTNIELFGQLKEPE
jgi:hypothetical protein